MSKVSEIMNLVNNYVDLVGEAISTIMKKEKSEAVTVARFELAQYMMYLSASDGEIRWEEAKLISEVCQLGFQTPQQVSAFIQENNIYSTEFEESVPLSFKILIQADNKLIDMGSTNEANICELVVFIYKSLGELLMNSDGSSSTNEETDCNIFISTLEDYAHNNSKRYTSTAYTHSKNYTSVAAPSKNGSVIAPRKG